MSGEPGAERAAATIGLLWRHAPGRPPQQPGRSGLTVDAVVEAALALADQEGLEAVTMRRLAAALGVSAMTPYSYVPGKAELVDLMLDTVYARMAATVDPGTPWRRRVAAVAGDNRRLHRAHPWTLRVAPVRPPLGPGLLGKYERELAAFAGIGLDDVETDAALSHLLALVRVSVLAEVEAAEAAGGSGLDDASWWEAVGPLLRQVVTDDAYPLASRVGTAAGSAHGSAYDPDTVYAFGLARFVDGIEALVERRRARPPVSRSTPS